MERKKEIYFYPKLKGIRNEFGYSLEDMAKILGVSKDCYFRKEKEKLIFIYVKSEKF